MTRRLVTTYLALTLVVLAALEIPLAVTYRQRQLDQLEAGLQRDAFLIAALVEDGLNKSDPTMSLQDVAANYQGQYAGRVVIVDNNGDVVADSAPPTDPATGEPETNRNFLGRPEIDGALAKDVMSGTRDSATLGTGLVYVAVPVASVDEVYGAVRVSYSTDQLDARVHRYWLLLAAAAIVTLAAAGGLGVLLARWVTRPLAELRDAAVRIGDGELDARADAGDAPPEVRELAEAFNTTAVRREQLVTAQEQFVADASHQLRTPLTALRLRLEMLEDESGPAAAEDLDAARREVLRLSRLVDGLLALARAERATGAVAPPPVRLADVLDDRCEAWRPVADERDVVLEADLDHTEGRVTPDHLAQALDNLVANALEVAPPGSSIRLWTGPGETPGTVEVHVTDHGPGLDTEQRVHAFDRFWRATTTRSELGGSGLGLAIVQKLATADGGRAELRETPGGGLDAVLVLQARS